MRVQDVPPLLNYLGDCDFIAIKTNWPSGRTDPTERAASVVANFHTLQSALQRKPSQQRDRVKA
jgi:hypothetical protein